MKLLLIGEKNILTELSIPLDADKKVSTLCLLFWKKIYKTKYLFLLDLLKETKIYLRCKSYQKQCWRRSAVLSVLKGKKQLVMKNVFHYINSEEAKKNSQTSRIIERSQI